MVSLVPRFPGINELCLGMAKLNLDGENLDQRTFENIHKLADTLGDLRISDECKTAGLLSVWVKERYSPFSGLRGLAAHLKCPDMVRGILREDPKKCVKMAKAYIKRGAPPEIQDRKSLYCVSVGLLKDTGLADDTFRNEMAQALIESVGGEAKVVPPKPPRVRRVGTEVPGSPMSLDRTVAEGIRKMVAASQDLSYLDQDRLMSQVAKLQNSLTEFRKLRETYQGDRRELLNRMINSFSRHLQPISDLSEAHDLYERVKEFVNV
ncbi:matrix protein [Wellfleet Bay virus]|uniref:Matrix protein n=1 Tax=Wellfleet Bay virus TaxID=1566309 RepID=A0A0A1E760_9ORTO|nr:matrix protein [Wellfleet Bay virus]AIY25034.1 matrix protein [Wellfleet Bay virus]